jgi:NADP-dependent 3-hydroxy acid dehydrogenase YdfG
MEGMRMSKPSVCCVIGAGDATGSAIARRFAQEGYTVCVARRSEQALQPLVQQIHEQGGNAIAFGLDARPDEEFSESIFNESA